MPLLNLKSRWRAPSPVSLDMMLTTELPVAWTRTLPWSVRVRSDALAAAHWQRASSQCGRSGLWAVGLPVAAVANTLLTPRADVNRAGARSPIPGKSGPGSARGPGSRFPQIGAGAPGGPGPGT